MLIQGMVDSVAEMWACSKRSGSRAARRTLSSKGTDVSRESCARLMEWHGVELATVRHGMSVVSV